MSAGRILIIDDEPAYLQPYQERLSKEGYYVEMAPDRDSALSRLADAQGWDVVVLDVKLRGRQGPDDGLDLLEDAQARAPFAKVIMISGVADEPSVRPAFEKGAYDYLEKGRLFGPLLSVKVRNAVELARERRLGAMEAQDREHLLQQLYQDALAEKGRQRKGQILEELMLLLFRSMPGFERATPQVRSAAEEIDIVILNQSTDPIWSKEGPFILVECKNWSKPVERSELDAFFGKLIRRGDRCRLGFFVALGGFSRGFAETLKPLAAQGYLVVPMGPGEVESLVLTDDRTARYERLKEIYQQAALQTQR